MQPYNCDQGAPLDEGSFVSSAPKTSVLERAARRSVRLMIGCAWYGAVVGSAFAAVIIAAGALNTDKGSAWQLGGMLVMCAGGAATIFAGAGAVAGAVGGLLRPDESSADGPRT